MDVKVGLPLSIKIGQTQNSLTAVVRTKSETLEKLNDTSPAPETPDYKSLQKLPDVAILPLDSIGRLAEIAKQASAEIASLRYKQLELAEEGAELAYGEQLDNLNSQFSEYQSTISTIASSATFRGQNVLTGKTYSSGEIDRGLIEDRTIIVGIADGAPLSKDLGLSLSTPANAETAEESLLQVAPALATLAASYASAVDKVNSATKSFQLPSDNVNFRAKEDITTIEEARDIAKQVAATIAKSSGSPYLKDEQTNNLIEISAGNLDPETVRYLIRNS